MAPEWQIHAEEIKVDILARAVDERSVLTQHYDTTALDASLLLAPLLRFLPPKDPIFRNTALAIADELTVDGFATRSTRPMAASVARKARSASARSGSCAR